MASKRSRATPASKSPRRVLVTGADGRLGSLLVPLLLKKGFRVRAVVLNARRAKLPASVERVELDLAHAHGTAFAKAMDGCQYAVHLAGAVSALAPLYKLYPLNVEATQKLAAAAKHAHVTRVVFMSSTSVYGNQTGVLTEKTPVKPANAYGRSKAMAEKAVRHSGVPFTILRAPPLYGPGFHEGFETVLRALQQGRMQLIGNGSNRVAFVHALDVANAIVLCLTHANAAGRTFNLAPLRRYSQGEVLLRAAQALKATPPSSSIHPTTAHWAAHARTAIEHFTHPNPRAHFEFVRVLSLDRIIDSTKAKRYLHWEARTSLDEGLAQTIRELKAKGRLR